MIKKLALCAFKGKILEPYIVITLFVCFIAFVVFLGICVFKRDPIWDLFLILTFFSMLLFVFLLISYYLLRKRAEKMPEAILERAKKIKRNKIDNPGTQAILELCMEKAINGDSSYLVRVWPLIETIFNEERSIKLHTENIKEAEKEMSHFFANSRDLHYLA